MIRIVTLTLTLLTLADCFYQGDSQVQSLTTQNFSKTKKGLWLVEFYAPWCGHCQHLTPEYEKAANALRGIANIAAVDSTKETTGVDVKGYPTIRFYNEGLQTQYNGGRTASEIVNWVLGEFKKIASTKLSSGGSHNGGHNHAGHDHSGHDHSSHDHDHDHDHNHDHGEAEEKDVVILEDANFNELVLDSNSAWFVEFYAPWCGHCKNLVPVWAQLATQLKGEIRVGKLDATQHQTAASQFSISGYPSIKFFPAGKKTANDAVSYQGGRSAAQFAEWGRQQLGAGVSRITHLASDDVYENKCRGKKVCIITFLPHILDSSEAEREKYLGVLRSVVDENKLKPFNFLWSQGGDQHDFEVAFGVDGAGYPTVLAVSEARRVSSRMVKSFKQQHLSEFVQSLLGKKGRFTAFKNDTPKLTQIQQSDSSQESQQHGSCGEEKCTATSDEVEL